MRNLCALALVVSVTKTSRADSLFPVKKASEGLRGSSASARYSLISDVRARNVGDLLIVTVSETTSATSQATTKVSKDENVSAFGGTGLFTRLFKDLAATANNSRAANGTGQTSRTGSFTTTLSAVVKEVLPNGNLKIEGSRSIQVNKENAENRVHGYCSPRRRVGRQLGQFFTHCAGRTHL